MQLWVAEPYVNEVVGVQVAELNLRLAELQNKSQPYGGRTKIKVESLIKTEPKTEPEEYVECWIM